MEVIFPFFESSVILGWWKGSSEENTPRPNYFLIFALKCVFLTALSTSLKVNLLEFCFVINACIFIGIPSWVEFL